MSKYTAAQAAKEIMKKTKQRFISIASNPEIDTILEELQEKTAHTKGMCIKLAVKDYHKKVVGSKKVVASIGERE